MFLINKFYGLLNRIISYFRKSSIKNDPTILLPDKLQEENISVQFDKEVELNEDGDKINVAKRTLMTKLYILEQEITVFENDFPEEYEAFMERIEVLRESYNSSLEEIKKLLTFEINPEIDSNKNGAVIKLERDIKIFIEKEVKFSIISKRLQRLITKLNILYNVSIFHSKESEKEKVISQLEHALESETRVVCEFKECDYILHDKQLKERIVSLISYVDYEIFKASIRNSKKTPDKLIEKLVMLVEFDEFDYISAFKAFIKDEISDLGELLQLIKDDECRKILGKRLTNLLTDLTYSDNTVNQVVDIAFWNNFLNFESSLLEILKDSGVEKEKIKVNLIVRMNISINESEVLVLPITNAYLSLINLYSITHNEKILLMIKILKNVSNDVTYKEIYFLLLLFDAIGVVKNNFNELIKHIEKYIKKYPYDQKTIMEKKKNVINSSNKEYVVAFSLKDYEKEIVRTLKSLNIDFKVINDNVFINSFYFNGLKNIFDSLQSNTKNIMI